MKIAFSIFIVFLFISSSSIHSQSSRNEKISLHEKDMAISLWYVMQFSAIQNLSEKFNMKIENSSKPTHSPRDLIDIQKRIIQSKAREKSDHRLDSWLKMQRSILEDLARSLKYEVDVKTIDSHDMKKKSLLYLEYQERIISYSENSIIPSQ